jgi:hypothetical protein
MKLSLLLQIGVLATLAPVVASAQEAQPPPAAPATEVTAPAAKPKAPPTVEVTVPPGCVLRPNAAGEPTVYCERDASTDQAEPPPARRWYGGYVLAADGASLLVGLTGALLPPMALVGFGGYLVAAPIVHWSRGHVGKGFASLGLRVGAITGGAVVGYALAEPRCKGDFAGLCALVYVVPLVVTGMVAATTIDAAAIAREDVKAPPREDARRAPATRRSAITVVPTLAITPTVQQAGVGGTF